MTRTVARALAALAVLLAAARAEATLCDLSHTGTTYYVCDCQSGADSDCVGGNTAANNSNPGTSMSAPWQTIDKARTFYSTAPAGTAILFCKGGKFGVPTSALWSNNNATASNRIVIASYTPPWASGNEGAPILRSGFDLENGGGACHKEGLTLADLHLLGDYTDAGANPVNATPENADAIKFYNDIDYVDVCRLEIEGFNIAAENAGGNDPNGACAGSDSSNDNINMISLNVHGNGGQGFLGCGADWLVDGCTFDGNGFDQVTFNHNMYLSCGQPRITIQNSTFRNNAVVSGLCHAVHLVIHGDMPGPILIKGNTFVQGVGTTGSDCYGISPEPGYSFSETFNGITMRGNYLEHMGGNAIAVGACQDCIAENNVVIGGAPISFDEAQVSTGDGHNTRDIVRNNSIYADTGAGPFIEVVDAGTGHYVVNNSVHAAASGTVNLLKLNLATTSYNEVDYNDFYSPSGGSVVWEQSRGDSKTTWNGRGFDTHSITTNPAFQSLSGPYDLSVLGTSPLVNAGDSTNGSTTGFAGNSITGNRDIGAYEYASGAPPTGKPATEIFIFLSSVDGMLRVRW